MRRGAARRGADGKPLITALQFEAGERLRDDFTRAQLQQRVTVDWTLPVAQSGASSGDRLERTESALEAQRRFRAALAAVGPGLSDLLIDVCCHLSGLEQAERARGWPTRAAKVVLCLALDRLAAHYGLVRKNAKAATIRSIRHA